MRKARYRLKPTLEPVEARRLLSGMVPVLTTATYRNAVVAVERVARELGRSHDVARASAALESIASTLPNGPAQLAPVWSADLAAYDPLVRGSALATRQRLVGDLRTEVTAGAAQGEFQLVGPGAHSLLRVAPRTTRDSVTLFNRTGLNITVTAFLTTTSRSIKQTIVRNGSFVFKIRSATKKIKSINEARGDRRTPPSPRRGIGLSPPHGG
ncbi:MAG: hypothetical protein P4L84_31470, partial [Isosphaeraceae bacterium]|nr:hypothetical protein [Isosphaeraceae bacterium]